jgi:Leucine-rich repeat (LRR) protein
MKKSLAIILICLSISLPVFGQIKWVNLAQASKMNPDSVLALDLSKLKLKSLPNEIFQYKNLEHLELSKNNLQQLPDTFAVFQQLKSLFLGKNKFETFPLIITRLTKLEILSMYRNLFSEIPNAIASCQSLKKIAFWDTPVTQFNEGFFKLNALTELDLSGIQYNEAFQKSLFERLPNTKIIIDVPCNCIR